MFAELRLIGPDGKQPRAVSVIEVFGRMADAPIRASVVIPTFRRPDFLRRAVASALAALPEDCEIVVSDDGDIDATKQALGAYQNAQLILSKNPGRSGAAANRNHGASIAKGQFLFFLDDDDLLMPGYLTHVLEWLAGNDTAVWGYSATSEHSDPSAKLAATPEPAAPTQRVGAIAKKDLAGLGCGFWIRRDIYQNHGGIFDDLTTNEDTDFCLSLLTSGHRPFFFPTSGVSLYKAERESLTETTPHLERARCFEKIYLRHKEFLASCPELEKFVLAGWSKHAGRARDMAIGWTAVRMARSTKLKMMCLSVLLSNSAVPRRFRKGS